MQVLCDFDGTLATCGPICRRPSTTSPARSTVRVAGARDALDQAASRGHGNHLASNHVPDLPDFLARLRLGDRFDHTFISGVVGHEKPSAEFWQHVEQTVAVDPGELVMVGDDWVRDIAPTIARGYHAVWVASSEKRAGRELPPAVRTADSIALVPAVLDGFRWRGGTDASHDYPGSEWQTLMSEPAALCSAPDSSH